MGWKIIRSRILHGAGITLMKKFTRMPRIRHAARREGSGLGRSDLHAGARAGATIPQLISA
ncbi:hypothetical protein BJF92_02560 [Rhizobium rhizosphaerae]|uniref:Uncharacterized protein n=1 Tax=Xaviernesmea rhizosphaerae TaxID=1672749 RepID=A0A1Q9AC63_9HYPH|nr:hypothetical protein BJF92_02560 [Xaviernesmea rhizosphaerae]OQP84235.1 hypothetical protein BTR14_19980 [Xaviernesmea rhizosphaerae]